MPFVGAFLLVHVFTAVLPPKDADQADHEYYHVLGLTKRGTRSADDIRKAYRKLSLELHPDKIAQRGSRSKYSAAEAAALYEKVQEAYTVLNDKKERAKYHSVHCSVARYKFVYQQGWTHPLSIIENISKASCWDKFRLVLVVVGIMLALLLQPILIAAKVNAFLEEEGSLKNASWNVILIPFWILYCLYILLQLIVFVLTKQRAIFLECCQHICFFVGVILLVREWERSSDRPRNSVNWNRLSTPFYMAVLFHTAALTEQVKALWRLHDILVSPDKMTSLIQEKLQQQKQSSSSNNDGDSEGQQDMTEDEAEELLRQVYVVVTPNEMTYEASLILLEQTSGEALTEGEKELLKIQSSPEYRHLQEQLNRTSVNVARVLVYGVILIALIAAKLEDNISASWWLVFLPVWIHMSFQFLSSCFVCCCVSGTGTVGDDEEIAVEDDGQPDDTESDEDTKEDKESVHIANGGAEKAKNSNNGKDREPVVLATGDNAEKDSGNDVRARGGKGLDKDVKANSTKQEDNGNNRRGSYKQAPVDPLMAEASEELFEPAESRNIPPREMPQKPGNRERAADDSPKHKDNDEDDEDGMPQLDSDGAEDAFRQWQKAHAQANDNAVEEAQARAHITFCSTIFNIVTFCLLVAKLEDAYDNDDDDVGFNAFWILFPTFLISGLLVCCFGCLVYATTDLSKMEEFMRQQQSSTQQNEEGGGGDPENPTASSMYDEEQGSNSHNNSIGKTTQEPTILVPRPPKVSSTNGTDGETRRPPTSSDRQKAASSQHRNDATSTPAQPLQSSSGHDKSQNASPTATTTIQTNEGTHQAPNLMDQGSDINDLD